MNGGKKGWGDQPFPPGQDPNKVRSTDVNLTVESVEGNEVSFKCEVPSGALDVLTPGAVIQAELKIGDFEEEETEEEEDETETPEEPEEPII